MSGSILRFKIREFKKDSPFVSWAKRQVLMRNTRTHCVYRNCSCVLDNCIQGRLGTGLNFFRAIVQKEKFKKWSQVILIFNLVQVIGLSVNVFILIPD
jgi:hypothetical protein